MLGVLFAGSLPELLVEALVFELTGLLASTTVLLSLGLIVELDDGVLPSVLEAELMLVVGLLSPITEVVPLFDPEFLPLCEVEPLLLAEPLCP